VASRYFSHGVPEQDTKIALKVKVNVNQTLNASKVHYNTYFYQLTSVSGEYKVYKLMNIYLNFARTDTVTDASRNNTAQLACRW